MRRISCTILSIFITLPAFSNARLPVVNVAAGGVSARAAFGDVAVAPVKTSTPTVVAQKATPKRTVVARPKKAPATTTVARAASADMGQNIATNDVLIPNRPSAHLWANDGDAPLRMPRASEFAVYRSNDLLPEESLDTAPIAQVTPRVAAPMATETVTTPRDTTTMSQIDEQIARLNELQRRADETMRTATVAAVRPAVTPRPAQVNVTPASEKIAVAEPAPAVNVRQMVVPMDDRVASSDVVMRTVQDTTSPRIAAVREDMTKMTPSQLRQAFRKTFLGQNKHLSTYQMDDRFDVVSDMTSSYEGFTARRDLSESGGIRPLEIKIKFRGDDSALSRDNYNLLAEYAGIVVSNPTRAIQISIPQNDAVDADVRKLTARRLAIVEQVLRDSGVSEQRIMPVLSPRDSEGFVLRMMSRDEYETLTQQQKNMFGDNVGKKKTYKSMSW